MCAGLPYFEIFEKKYAESRRRPICSSYAKGHQNRSSSFAYFLRYIWSKTRNMHICAAFPHFLRFLKKNTWSHVLDRYVVFMQKGIKIGPVVSDRIVFETRIVKFLFFNPFFVQCCHILKKMKL